MEGGPEEMNKKVKVEAYSHCPLYTELIQVLAGTGKNCDENGGYGGRA